VAVLAPRGRLAAAVGAGFALATLAGYLLSMWMGLFGFREVRTTAGVVAGIIEVAAFAALAVVALSPPGTPLRSPGKRRSGAGPLPAPTAAGPLHRLLSDGFPRANWAVSGICAVALALLGTAVATSGGPTASTGGHTLKTATINGVTVLTNSRGLTLYWFAADSPGVSRCYGSCAQYWPPVTGTPTAGPGVTGTLGTIKRTGGGLQATYNGRPLYTYIADGGPGQDRGNNLNLNGGLWHQVVVGS